MNRKDIITALEVISTCQEVQPDPILDKAEEAINKLYEVELDIDAYETAIKVLATIGGHEKVVEHIRNEL